jgi:hypothetical protein
LWAAFAASRGVGVGGAVIKEIQMTTPEPLRPSPDCPLVFVDDTGNESFRGQPYFGLGGIMLAARENEALLKPRWRALRKIVHGSEDQPLHASKLGRVGNSERRFKSEVQQDSIDGMAE